MHNGKNSERNGQTLRGGSIKAMCEEAALLMTVDIELDNKTADRLRRAMMRDTAAAFWGWEDYGRLAEMLIDVIQITENKTESHTLVEALNIVYARCRENAVPPAVKTG